MTAEQLLVIAASWATLFAYICRLSMMSWRTTIPMILVMHLSLALAVVWSGYRAWIGDIDLGDVCAVVAAISWIVVSYKTWRTGVPSHFSRPMELDEKDYRNVWGGWK